MNIVDLPWIKQQFQFVLALVSSQNVVWLVDSKGNRATPIRWRIQFLLITHRGASSLEIITFSPGGHSLDREAISLGFTSLINNRDLIGFHVAWFRSTFLSLLVTISIRSWSPWYATASPICQPGHILIESMSNDCSLWQPSHAHLAAHRNDLMHLVLQKYRYAKLH